MKHFDESNSMTETEPTAAELAAVEIPEPEEPVPEAEKSVSGKKNNEEDGADVVRAYLREIGKIPLLTAEEEQELGLRVLEGDRAAVEKLVNSNLRLVVSVARKSLGSGMPLADLIQEGNLGLMKAAERFDCRKGYRFSTYATWWIRQSVSRGIADRGSVIRIPVHMYEQVSRLRRTRAALLQELGREPTVEELAETLNVSPERVRSVMGVISAPVSLDDPVGESDDGGTLGELIADGAADDPEEAALTSSLREEMEKLLNRLQPREEQVIRLRYGLDDGREHTLEEIGRELKITRERVRQIEAKALRQLARYGYKSGLREYSA